MEMNLATLIERTKKETLITQGFFTLINDGVLEYELPYRVMHVSSKA